jgi:2-hydroxychromene-2-carboxylate isomerase
MACGGCPTRNANLIEGTSIVAAAFSSSQPTMRVTVIASALLLSSVAAFVPPHFGYAVVRTTSVNGQSPAAQRLPFSKGQLPSQVVGLGLAASTQSTARVTEDRTKKAKKVWKVFWDLQCPFARKSWAQLDELKERFSDDYNFEINLTSLLFHRQAFTAQCAANLIARHKGPEAKLRFINACYTNQERYVDSAVGDARPSEVDAIFAAIANEAGLFDEGFTQEYFLSKIHDKEEAVVPAWTEHKLALSYGVFGTAKFVIDDKLVKDTESDWGADEWEQKLETLDK